MEKLPLLSAEFNARALYERELDKIFNKLYVERLKPLILNCFYALRERPNVGFCFNQIIIRVRDADPRFRDRDVELAIARLLEEGIICYWEPTGTLILTAKGEDLCA